MNTMNPVWVPQNVTHGEAGTENINGMGEAPPRNQFSLTKTLLWTAAVAGYLGLYY